MTSEAQAMKNYLIKQGIDEKSIIVEDESKNTFENIRNSNKLIKELNPNAKLAFATTNYHVFRGGICATDQNIEIEGIGARTKMYFWVNAFIRELIATIVSEKKKHLIVVIMLFLIMILINIFLYINNVM